MTERQQPLIAIDVVPIGYDQSTQKLRYGTATRQFEPFAGEQALPGVLLGPDETLEEAARRALADKGGFHPGKVTHLTQVGAFDGPGRDPRDKAMSVAFLAVIAPHPSRLITWRDWGDVGGMPFDHDRILEAAKDVARTRLWGDQAFTRAVTGETFSTRDASTIAATLTGTAPHAGNLHRQLSGLNGLIATGKAESTVAGGRRATTWAWGSTPG